MRRWAAVGVAIVVGAGLGAALGVAPVAVARAAPTVAVIVGRVVDADTGEPLPGVPVTIGAALVFTDQEGGFTAEVDPGPITIVVEADYLERRTVEVTLGPGERRTVELAVKLDLAGAETVVIEDRGPLAPGTTRIAAADAARQAGTGGDAIKAIQHAPGVARAAAGSRDVVVWGAAPQDTAILVDDVPVPALYHLGGWRSIVPTELVDALAIDRAGFATPWNGATGGLVRVTTRELPARPTLTVASDLLDTGVVGTARVGPARVGLGARASYLDRVLGGALDAKVGERIPIPRWADGQLLVQVPRGDDRYDVLVLLGADRLSRRLPALDPAAVKGDDRRDDFARVALAWRRRLDDGEARLRGWVGYDVAERDQRFGAVPARLHARTSSAGLRAERRTSIADVVVLLGLDGSLARARLDRRGTLSIPTREGDVSVFGQPPGDDVATDQWSALTGDAGAYAQLDIVRRGVTISPGLRVDGWVLGASRLTPRIGTTPGLGYQRVELTVEPRLAATMRRGRLSLGGAAGLYHQPRRADDTSAVFGTPALGLEHAWHATATVAVRVAVADLELTGWGRRTRALVARDPSATPPLAATLTQEGRGRALGLEVVARLRAWHGLSGWIAYGLSSSERRDHDQRAWRRFEHDQPHQLTVAATWQRGPWTASTRLRFATGEPRTDVVAAFWDASAGRYQPVTGPIYGTRLPDFVQLDVHGERAFAVAGSRLSGFVELQNLTARANAEELVWSGDYATSGYLTGLPFLALVGARWSP